MSQELHYTSSPRGLKPGSRGFCTVACTAGLSPTLAERLEGLSGYRPKHPPHHPEAALNPVNWSHLRLNSAGQTASVLSRVGPAGLDYTDRPNKYAHHVVLESGERAAGGPAWMLSQPGFMESTWAGSPQILPAGRRPPSGDRPAGVCRTWAERLGDAGWAGVVAESFLADTKRPTILVYDPGTDILSLFVEAIALLPAERRWEVTFSTFYTGLPAGTTCSWRGVLRDSPEERQARGNPEALILDLGQTHGNAQGGAFVTSARTGEPVESSLPPTRSVSPSREVHVPSRRNAASAIPLAEQATHLPEKVEEYSMAPPLLIHKAGTQATRGKAPQVRRPMWFFATAVAASFLLGVVFGGAGIAYLLAGSPRLPVVALARKAEGTKTPTVEKEEAASTLRLPQPGSKLFELGEGNGDESPSTVAPDLSKNQGVAHSEIAALPARKLPPPEPATAKGVGDSKPQTGAVSQAQASGGGGGSNEKIEDISKNDKFASQPAGNLGKSVPETRTQASEASKDSGLIPVRFFPIRLGNPDPLLGGKPPMVFTDEAVRSLTLIGLKDPANQTHEFKAETPQGKAGLVVYSGKDAGKNELATFGWNGTQVTFAWSSMSLGMDNVVKEALRDCVLKVENEKGEFAYYVLRDINVCQMPDSLRILANKSSSRRAGKLEMPFLWRTPDGGDTTRLANSKLIPRLVALKFTRGEDIEVLKPDPGDSRVLATSKREVQASISEAALDQIRIVITPAPKSLDEIRKMKSTLAENESMAKTQPGGLLVQKNKLENDAQEIKEHERFSGWIEKIVGSHIDVAIAIKVGGQDFLLPMPASARADGKGGTP